MKARFKIYILIVFYFTFSKVHAQKTTPLVIGLTQEINSVELSEKRLLNIYLPEGYQPNDTTTYPVIYLLDGSTNEDFLHICGLVQFFTLQLNMPKTIVVGIANVDRKRDFTFPTTIAQDKKDFPTTGGSQKFISFLEKEVQPFVQANYKTNNVTTIIGQSLGGLLATEILLTKPSLFTKYIIVSPSLWWNKESLLTIPQTPSTTQQHIFIAVGKEGSTMEKDAKKLANKLQEFSSNMVQFQYFPNENHATILHNAVYKAFEVLNKTN